MSLGMRRFLVYGLAMGLFFVLIDAGPFLLVVSQPKGSLKLGKIVFICYFPMMALQCASAWAIARKCRPEWAWGLVGFAIKMWLMGLAVVVSALVPRANLGGWAGLLIFVTGWELQQALWVWLAGYIGFYPFRRTTPQSTV